MEKDKHLEIEAKRHEAIIKFADAWDNPPLIGELEAHMAQVDELVKKIARGEIVDDIEIESEPGSVELPDFDTLKRLLVAIKLDSATVEELVEHEKAHYEEIKNFGFIPKIHLTVYRGDNGNKGVKPSVSFEIPKGMDKEIVKRHLRVILEAPIDISPSDEDRIKSFE